MKLFKVDSPLFDIAVHCFTVLFFVCLFVWFFSTTNCLRLKTLSAHALNIYIVVVFTFVWSRLIQKDLEQDLAQARQQVLELESRLLAQETSASASAMSQSVVPLTGQSSQTTDRLHGMEEVGFMDYFSEKKT